MKPAELPEEDRSHTAFPSFCQYMKRYQEPSCFCHALETVLAERNHWTEERLVSAWLFFKEGWEACENS